MGLFAAKNILSYREREGKKGGESHRVKSKRGVENIRIWENGREGEREEKLGE